MNTAAQHSHSLDHAPVHVLPLRLDAGKSKCARTLWYAGGGGAGYCAEHPLADSLGTHAGGRTSMHECDGADMVGEFVHGPEGVGRVHAYFPNDGKFGILPTGNIFKGESDMKLIEEVELLGRGAAWTIVTMDDQSLAAWTGRGSVPWTARMWRAVDWQG